MLEVGGGKSCGNFSLRLEIRNVTQERLPQTRILKGDIEIGLEVAYAVARIVMLAFKAGKDADAGKPN